MSFGTGLVIFIVGATVGYLVGIGMWLWSIARDIHDMEVKIIELRSEISTEEVNGNGMSSETRS